MGNQTGCVMNKIIVIKAAAAIAAAAVASTTIASANPFFLFGQPIQAAPRRPGPG